MWKTMDEETLKSKKVVELKEIAKTFGLKGYQKMKKAELVAALMKDEPDDKKDAAKAEAAAPKKGRKAAGGSSAVKSAATAAPGSSGNVCASGRQVSGRTRRSSGSR